MFWWLYILIRFVFFRNGYFLDILFELESKKGDKRILVCKDFVCSLICGIFIDNNSNL